MIVLLGCTSSSVVVNSDYDPSANFLGYQTYGWLATPTESTGDPRLNSPLLDARIRNAVETQLKAKGYTKANTGSPDILVNYHVMVRGALDIRTINDVYGYGPRHLRGWGAAGSTTHVRQVEEGTLLLDFLDPATQNLLWRGTAKGFVEPSLHPTEREKRIQDIIKRILDQFPPK
jgi:hypothetical protein